MTHLDPKSLICGYPALQVRSILRLASPPYSIRPDIVAESLHVSRRNAARLIADLAASGYLKQSEDDPAGWSTDAFGLRVSIANATHQIKRGTADRLVAGLVQRLHTLQNHPDFLHRVSGAWVFGSYVTEADRLSDVDIALRFVERYADSEVRYREKMKRVRQATKQRRFGNITAMYSWPFTEVWRFLRARSPYLELHDLAEEPHLSEAPGIRRIFPVQE